MTLKRAFDNRNKQSIISKKKKIISSDEEILSESDLDTSVISKDEMFKTETPHEKHVRLTKKALSKALESVGSDDEATDYLSQRFQEEALHVHGKLFAMIASKLKPIEASSFVSLLGHKKSVNCVCISSESEYVYSGGKDACIIKWRINDHTKCAKAVGGRFGSKSEHHTGPVLAITISYSGKYLASGSADNSVIIWNPETLKPISKLKKHFAAVTALDFQKHSHTLFSGDKSGRVCVWSLPLTEHYQDQGAATKVEILSICGLTTERCISSSGFGGAGICMWKVSEEVCVQYSAKNKFEHSIEATYAINDQLFVGGSTSNTLYLWHMSRGSPICTVTQAHPEVITLLSQPADRAAVNWVTAVSGLFGTDLIASGSSNGHVQLWRVVQDDKLFSFSADHDWNSKRIGRLQFHHDTAKLERVIGGQFSLEGYINGLAFSRDGRWLIAAVGQEHRLGRWEKRRKVRDTVCLLPINAPIRTPEF